jgi:hypothetical protein
VSLAALHAWAAEEAAGFVSLVAEAGGDVVQRRVDAEVEWELYSRRQAAEGL